MTKAKHTPIYPLTILAVWLLILGPGSLLANDAPSEIPIQNTSSSITPKVATKDQVSEPDPSRIRQKDKTESEAEGRKNIQNATSVRNNKSGHDPNKSTNNANYKFSNDLALAFGPPTWGTWVLAVVAFFGALVAYRTLRNIERQTESIRDTATAAIKQTESILISDRAYIKMSHYPPGLVRFNDTRMYEVRIRVKNFGQTPATIKTIVIKDEIRDNTNPLPDVPDYTSKRPNPITDVFLVTNDEFTIYYAPTILGPEMKSIERREKILFIYGYVDYVDKFEIRHRAGYARLYDPGIDYRGPDVSDEAFRNRSNLAYVAQPGYNYDRLRKQGEGKDWETHV